MVAPRPHDADAGGDPEALQAKADLREHAWTALQEAGAARFPGARHRIPNFSGAEDVAERLRATEAWAGARVVKCNPTARSGPCASGPSRTARRWCWPCRVWPRTRRSCGSTRIDLVVQGCVAADADGARLGKGGGFADLEFAILSAAGLLADDVVVATTVHDVQVLDRGRIPVRPHDVRLDLVVAPSRVLRTEAAATAEAWIRWEDLTEDKIAAIPRLSRLRPDEPS